MIDTLAIKKTYKISDHTHNLKQIGRYQVGPCPMCGGADRFTIKPTEEGEVWFCRNCGDDRYHDVIELVKRLNKCNLVTATNILTGGDFSTIENTPETSKPRNITKVSEQSWQDKAYGIWSASHERLIGSLDRGEFNACFSWLMNRGITLNEVKKFGLGFHPGGAGLARGVVVPSFFNGNIQYLKVRKKGQKKINKDGKTVLFDKYRQLAGGKSNSLFNADSIKEGIKNVIVIEGEFDVMLVSRYVESNTTVVTMGSTSQIPKFSEWGCLFAAVENMYVFQDGDEAGEKALSKWLERYPYSRSMKSLGGGDVTDYWKEHKGDGILSWLKKSGVS